MKKILIIAALFFLVSCSEQTEEQSPNTNTPAKTGRVNTAHELKYSENADFKVLSITEDQYKNAPALQINLSLPAANQISEGITVTTNNQSVNGDWIYSDNKRVLYFPFIQPETEYQVAIEATLSSINNKQLSTPFAKTIKTNPKQKKVRFVSSGNTLLRESNKLPIEAVNVSAVDLKFWKIHPDKYHRFLMNPNMKDIYYLDKISEFADLIYTGQFAIDSERNKTEVHNISLADIKTIQQSGLYFVTMIPSDNYPYEVESSWFSITNLGLQSRMYKNSMAVFTHNLSTAEPFADVELTLYDEKGNQLEKQNSSDKGFARFTNENIHKANLLIATKGYESNIIRMNQMPMDLSEFNLAYRKHKPQELFLYSPRNLYRPGETVHINALLRDDDGQLVKATPVRVEIKRPDNRTIKTINWQGDENSFYTTEFNVPKDAMTGTWQFHAKLANNDIFNYEFAVEDFMPERLKLDLNAGDNGSNISSLETPQIQVQSDYLYGAPAAKNRYDATVTIKAQTQMFEFKDYVFGSNNYKDYDYNFTTPSKLLDEKGSGVISIQPNWAETQFPLQIKSHVNVYESGGRPISRKIEHTIWPHEIAVGVKQLWDGDYASPNSDSMVELIAINRQGERTELNNSEVLLIRENSQRYWHWGDDGWSYNQSEKNVPVFSDIINIGKDDASVIQFPLDYGYYRLEVRDENQNLITSNRFFSGWRWYDPDYANAEKPDQVNLQWQSHSVAPNADAKLKVVAPYTGTALVTVESDDLLWQKTIQLEKAEQIIDIPVMSNWKRHDLHATVMVINQGELKRKHLPKRAFGVIHLPLNRDNRKINLAIEAPEKTLPDREITIKVKATNLDKETPSFVTLAAVDTGVLSISNFKTPKPHDWFFEERGYITAIRDIYGSIIALMDGKNATQKFGGDADINRGGEAPGSDVQIVSLLSEKTPFDKNGEAEIKFKLPYFNGEVRLMALAFNDNQFAGTDTHMEIAAPVVIETSLPRFIAKGDQTFATIDVHNTEDNEQTIDLQVIASDSLGGKILNQQVKLAANEKQILQLPLLAEVYSGMGQVSVVANMKRNDNFSVNRSWGLGIRPAYPAVVNSTTEVIDLDKSYNLDSNLFANLDESNLKSVLKISNTPVLNAEEHIQQLIQYPYGCLEQTTSRAWPLLLVEKQDLGLFTSEKQAEIFSKRTELIEQAIGRVLGMQRYDGSFGLWNNDSPEEYWLTVYATEFLLKARSLGYTISQQAIDNAVKRLQYYVKGRNYLYSDLKKYLSNENYYKLSYQAYAAYVLASVKSVNLQDVRKIYDSNYQNSKGPLPLAYLALALEQLGDNQRAKDAWQRAIDFKWQQNRYSYYGDYGSKVRDYAQIIGLSLQSNLAQSLPSSALQLVKPLQSEILSNRWLSTQERGALFRTAKELDKNRNGNEKWNASLSINDEENIYNQAEDLIKVLHDKKAKSSITITNNGNMPLYLDFKTQGYSLKPQAESNGIKVKRRYFNLQGDNLDISNIKTGDMVLVHINMTLDKKYSYLPDAMLVELLPAGLELENQNLEHSMKLDEIKIDGKYIYDWTSNTYVKHSEYRDDRFIAALSLSSYKDNDLFYLARAVTPGEFTVPPSLVEDMYRPEIRAVGKADGQMVITEK
jgi:hypothetical protein